MTSWVIRGTRLENEGEELERIFEDVVGYNGRKDELLEKWYAVRKDNEARAS